MSYICCCNFIWSTHRLYVQGRPCKVLFTFSLAFLEIFYLTSCTVLLFKWLGFWARLQPCSNTWFFFPQYFVFWFSMIIAWRFSHLLDFLQSNMKRISTISEIYGCIWLITAYRRITKIMSSMIRTFVYLYILNGLDAGSRIGFWNCWFALSLFENFIRVTRPIIKMNA